MSKNQQGDYLTKKKKIMAYFKDVKEDKSINTYTHIES